MARKGRIDGCMCTEDEGKDGKECSVDYEAAVDQRY